MLRKTPVATGGGAGAVIGGIAGLAVGLGAMAIPGIGPAIAVGPLAVAIGSLGIGAAAGGIIGALAATIPEGGPSEAAAEAERQESAAIEHEATHEVAHNVTRGTPSGARVYLDGLEMAPREMDPRVSRFEDFEPDYRADFKARNLAGSTYEQFSPAYRYGYNLASDPRFAHEDWLAVEDYARREWENDNPGSWDKVKDVLRYAWQSHRSARASG